MTKKVVVPLNFTPDDLHLMQECIKAVHDNLCDELEPECKQYVRKRCKEVLLKIHDFIIEASFLSKEANSADDQGMADDPSSSSFYCSVFGSGGKKQRFN